MRRIRDIHMPCYTEIHLHLFYLKYVFTPYLRLNEGIYATCIPFCSHTLFKVKKKKKTTQNLYSKHKKKCSLQWRCLKTLWNFKTNSTFLWLSSIIINSSNSNSREFIWFYNENAHSENFLPVCMPCLLNLVVSIRGICLSTLIEQTYKFKEYYFVGCRSRSWNDSISFSFTIFLYIYRYRVQQVEIYKCSVF